MIGRALDDIALRIWIDLVRLGGYYSAAAYRYHAQHLTHAQARERLNSLAHNGMVRMRRAANHRREYGVTTSCKAPPGYEHLMRPPVASSAGSPGPVSPPPFHPL